MNKNQSNSAINGAPSAKPLPKAQPLWRDRFHLLIDCRDEANQRKLYEQLKTQGFNCRVLVL